MFLTNDLSEEFVEFLDSFPLAEQFIKRLPIRPRCTNEFESGTPRKAPYDALHTTNIQANPHCFVHWLTFDVDQDQAASAWEDAVLPPPNLIVINPQNGHAHISYLLETPVYTGDTARPKPIYLMELIYDHFRRALKADQDYNQLLTKNPFSEKWRTICPRTQPYDLEELAEYLPKKCGKPRLKDRGQLACGRHMRLFDSLRHWAYTQRNIRASCSTQEQWIDELRHIAEQLNAEFETPLGLAEVKAIAKSVGRWVWKHFSEQRFSEIQRSRALRGAGKAGRRCNPDSEASRRPWLSMGISRRQYYYHKKSLSVNST